MRKTAASTRPPRGLMKAAAELFEERFGSEEAARILESAADYFAEGAPDLPAEGNLSTREHLRWALFAAALYRVLKGEGVAGEEALELAAEVNWRVVRRWAALPVRLSRLSPADPFRGVVKLSRLTIYRDWTMEDIPAESGFGFDVVRCPVADYLRPLKLGEVCERTICAMDDRLAEMRGVRLVRTGTLAGGAARCDFRFPEDG